MSLPLTHAGLSAPGISAALDLKFASTLSLTSSSGITPSYSRASTGTYLNSSGVLTSAAINAPRFDHTYNGTSWISRGLLVEEQRTNTALWSEDFSNAAWTKQNGGTISSNAGVAPDGNTTADLCYPATSGTFRGFYRSFSSQSVTVSIFAKASGKTSFGFIASDGNSVGASFNLSNGTVSDLYAGHTATITPVGNGWYRCTMTATTTLLQTFIQDSQGSSGSVTANSTDGILFWGAMQESGTFATSYIPTTSASATRSADVCQITGGDFSSFWNASEGSFAVEFDRLANNSSGLSGGYPTTLAAASSNNDWIILAGSIAPSPVGEVLAVYSSTSQAYFSAGSSPLAGVTAKMAACYKANDFAASLNGSTVSTDTSGTVPACDRLGIGYWPFGNAPINGHIARLRYFNKRLTDKQLEDLCRPEDQLKLDLKFSENLSLTPVVGPTPSFSRASTGTYFNSSGVLTSAAINAPRFDHTYDGTSWISKGLLIEEQRTNTALYSSDIGNAYWGGTSSKTANFGISPDGTQNAARITGGGYFQSGGISKTGTQTFSFWAKTISGNSENIDVYLDGGFTTTSKTITGSWVRYSVTQTFGSTNTGTIGIYPLSASILFYGPQLELGSFSTSYIPTTSSSVVRSADVCQITGTDFSGMWNASEGSFAVEYSLPSAALADRGLLNANDGTTLKYVAMYAQSGSGQPGKNTMIVINSLLQANIYGATVSANTLTKIAGAWRANDFANYSQGVAGTPDSTGTIPSPLTQLEIGRGYPASAFDPIQIGHISRIRYYAIRLPNRLLLAKSQ